MSDIEIIIRVHDTDRPLDRAIASVLDYERASVLIVAHGIPADSIPVPDTHRVKVVEAPGGHGFPGVASNAGVQAVTAPLVGFLDSDDYFERGALESLHRRLVEDGADGVIIPRRTEGKQRSLLPVTLRRRGLRAGRDRLFYYTAPFGLYRRGALQSPALAFDETVRTGEDIGTSALLWTAGLNLSHHPGDPAYVVTDEAPRRATRGGDVRTRLAAINNVLATGRLDHLSRNDRVAWAIKTVRVNILSGILGGGEPLPVEDRKALARTLEALLAFSPQALEVFSRADRDRLDRALNGAGPGDAKQGSRARRTLAALPRKPWRALHRESNLRRVAVTALHEVLSRRS